MLQVRLLGQFDVRRDGAPIAIPARAAQALLAYLLLTAGTAHRREKLAGLLWPDTTDENARSNLRHELWRLRKAIETKGPQRGVTYLEVDEISIRFNPESDYWLDVSLLLESPARLSADRLIEILSLGSGELLPGFYQEWVVLERERLRAGFEQKMERLLELLVAEKRWQETLEWGERWISSGQTPEPAYRALMVAHGALGNRSQVAAAYERCVRAMRHELGVEPSEQTRALYERLAKNQALPAVAEPGAGVPEAKPKRTPPEMTGEPTAAAAAASRAPFKLPTPLTSFIGREREIQQVEQRLAAARLLTLVGAGGVGKTRLASQVATDLRQHFADGIAWVDLGPLMDEALVPQAVARVLDVRESPGQPLIESLAGFIREKQMLLVLDNCEHLVAACAQLADNLLTRCPNLRILGTSREVLGITGEMLYHVPSLSLPESAQLPGKYELMEYEGIRLFVERARAVKSDFVLSENNAQPVLEICRRLDGIPLALELAAARTKLLTVGNIAQRLNDRFSLLTQGSRTALPRQQTLRATIDWSYDLLPEPARILFRRLALFVGGFTLEAAEAVASEAPLSPAEVLDLLTRLVDRSLVKAERQGEYARYYLLETIREYAREKLEESGETERLRRRHRDFMVGFAEQAEPGLKSAQQFEWLDRLDVEHDNLRAAWEVALQTDLEAALRLASALLDFWSMRANPGEGRQWLAQLLDRTNDWGPTARRAHVLALAGRLAYLQRDFAAARRLLEQALAIARASGDRREIGYALLWLGWTVLRQRDSDRTAQALSEECLELYQALQDSWGMAMALYHLAGIAATQGHYTEAEERYNQSLARFRELGDRFRAGYVLNGMGELARLLGDYGRAGQFYEEHIEILRKQRSGVALVIPLVNQAWVSLHEGHYAKSQALFEESMDLSNEYGNKTALLDCLAGLAAVRGIGGQAEPAARLFGAVEALLERIGMGGRRDPADQKEFDHYVGVVRAQLDDAAFAKAWAEGRSMTLEQAIAYGSEDWRKGSAPLRSSRSTALPGA